MNKQALVIFAKNPEAGKVKTRLAASIGNEAALAIYKQLQLSTVSVTQYLPVDKFIFYSTQIEQEDVWSNTEYNKEVQEGNDLGERMKNAFASLFSKGYDRVIVIGTDCPDLSTNIIMNAFAVLQSHDIAIGPAKDGGYYLLGMKKLNHQLFKEIQWSTSTVLHDTLQKCIASGLRYCMLPVLNDIDDEKDLLTSKLQSQ